MNFHNEFTLKWSFMYLCIWNGTCEYWQECSLQNSRQSHGWSWRISCNNYNGFLCISIYMILLDTLFPFLFYTYMITFIGIPGWSLIDIWVTLRITKSMLQIFDRMLVNQMACSPWRRHQMETFSALQALCAGNSPVTGEFPAQRPVTRSLSLWCFFLSAPE